jgi:hypothetical protein
MKHIQHNIDTYYGDPTSVQVVSAPFAAAAYPHI